MRLARFDDDRIGVVEGDLVYDVSGALDQLSPLRWPPPPGDQLIAELERLAPVFRRARETAKGTPLSQVTLRSPVASPSKIVAAPGNYRDHVQLDGADPEISLSAEHERVKQMDRPVDSLGLFLKSSTALVGPGDGVVVDWPGPPRRCDHEVELGIVIGRTARHVSRDDAFSFVAGYAIALDITIRGTEDRSFRKSADTFAVLGPWLATPDELADPNDTEFWITVNGEHRQRSSTRFLTVGLAELIEIASNVYTLYPGDIIMTGTPQGVGPIAPGDIVAAGCDGVGEMQLTVHAPVPRR